MENKELIYEMAKRLDLVIEVTKNGIYQNRYKFINNKLHKLNEKSKELHKLQEDKTDRTIQFRQ
jgi:hypothetical protein